MMDATPETGSVIDKDALREILVRLDARSGFSPGVLGIEQATNAILRLQRAPRNVTEIALTVACDYCGRTAGNACRRGDAPKFRAHPSRLRKALGENGE